MKSVSNKPVLSLACVLMSLVLLSGCQASAVETTVRPVIVDSAEADLAIYRLNNSEDPVYVVNGKTLRWRELSSEQQQKIRLIEERLNAAEKKLAIDEKQFEAIAEKMQAVAKVIELEASKLEEATIIFEKKEISFKDLSEISQRLEKKAQVNEALMHEKEIELRQLEAQLPEIDESVLQEIESQAHAMESLLIEIAAQMP